MVVNILIVFDFGISMITLLLFHIGCRSKMILKEEGLFQGDYVRIWRARYFQILAAIIVTQGIQILLLRAWWPLMHDYIMRGIL